MLKKIMFVAVLLGVSAAFGFGQSAAGGDGAANEIEKLEKEVSGARRKSDTKVLARIYADDFEGITASGTETTKSDILTFYDGSKGSGDSIRETDQEKIRIFDKTAIVTGRLQYRSGRPDSETFWMRFTRVYANRNGTWQIVAEHYTFLKDGID